MHHRFVNLLSGPNFISVQSMVNYEVTNNLTTSHVNHGRTPSGSRTLLRLHRALEFILSFMREIHTLKVHISLSLSLFPARGE